MATESEEFPVSEPAGEAASGEPPVLLRATDVRKHFGGIKAVDGMDIAVREGELVSLIGPNGAGKTTFFNVVAGTYKGDSGEVWFNGESIEHLPPYRVARRGLVRTFQLTRALSRMTVLENLMLAPTNQLGEHMWAPVIPFVARSRIKEQEAQILERANEMLDYFEIDHLREEYAGALSGGQKKLLELARALMLEPRMLLLDEPMAGVNPTLAKKLMERIQDIRRSMGITILFIEHDMETVMGHSDRIVVMAEGRPLAEGTPEEIQNNEEVIEAYLGG